MKYISLILGLLLIIASHVFALQATGYMTATVTVQGNFFLLVDTDSFDFANLYPGQTGGMTRKEGIKVSCASSNGNPYYLKVTSNPLSSGSDMIPNDNFSWYGTSEGQGSWNGVKEKTFTDQKNAAYISSYDESNSAEKIAHKFNFNLHVPEDTKPGSYTTTVMFTLTE